jgi:hypothetical protein
MEAKVVRNQDVLVDLEKADCVLAREDTKGMHVNSLLDMKGNAGRLIG